MTQLTNAEFKTQTTTLYPTNGVGSISAADLRTQMDNIADSVPFKTTGATSAPTVNDDVSNTSGNGAIQIGDIWVNETTDIAYICLDNTATAAVWSIIGSSTGTVGISGSPVFKQLAFWATGAEIAGDNDLTWDSVTGTLAITGDVTISGELIHNPAIVSVSSSRSLALTDARDILEIDTSGGAVAITIPANASVAFDIGTIINLTLIDSTSAATIVADTGVTLNGVSTGTGTITATAYSAVRLYKKATDEWIATYDIGTVA